MRKIRKTIIIGIIFGLLATLLVYALPSITISSPSNATISDNTPDLNFTATEPSNMTYNWDGEGNISGCRNCTSYSTTYGEYVNLSEQNLSALWHFNENFSSGVYDNSANGNDGTITAATWTTGKFGPALEFDGSSDYVEVPHSVSLNITDEITLLAWIKPSTLTAGYHTIVEKYNDDYGIYTRGTFINFYLATPYREAEGGTLTTDTWYCVAGTFDGSIARAYINGTEVAIDSASPDSLQTSGNSLRIGGNSGDQDFNGTIDEIAIFDRVLSQTEISAFCNKTLNDGAHNVAIYAENASGDINTSTQYFTVDTVPPYRIDLNSPSNNSNVSNPVNFSWTSYDATSNIMYSNLTINGTVVNSPISTINGTPTTTVYSLTDGTHNWSITTWDDAGNSNSSVTLYFTVDGTPPYYTANYTYPAAPYDNESVNCSSYWIDNRELDSAIIEENATGILQNHTVSLSGNEGWGNYTIDASILEAGIVQCRVYVNDTVGNWNSTPPWNFTVRDSTAPSITNITYSPSTIDDLDPNVTINVTANVTDFTAVSNVTLQYKQANETTWLNFTMNNTYGDIYEGNFTPDVVNNWTFRIWANDSDNNINITDNITRSIDYDWTWTRTPASFGTVNGYVGTNVTLGNLTIGNTGDYDLNFELTSDRTWVSFNVTNASAVNVSNGSTITVQVNASVPTIEATYPVTITIDATNTSAAPTSNTTTATLNALPVSGPFLYVEIPTYDPSVTQGDTGINLTARVTNLGNESATDVWLAWILPTGWTNTSGNLNLNSVKFT